MRSYRDRQGVVVEQGVPGSNTDGHPRYSHGMKGIGSQPTGLLFTIGPSFICAAQSFSLLRDLRHKGARITHNERRVATTDPDRLRAVSGTMKSDSSMNRPQALASLLLADDRYRSGRTDSTSHFIHNSNQSVHFLASRIARRSVHSGMRSFKEFSRLVVGMKGSGLDHGRVY